MNVTTSNVSIKEINNNFNKIISLTDTVSQTKNNDTNEVIETIQEITVNEPIDSNTGMVPNLDPITFVDEKALKLRTNTNSDSRGIYRYNRIKTENYLSIEARRTPELINLIRLSALSNTSIDILDDFGSIIKTIDDVNTLLFSSDILSHIIKNTNNTFDNKELENYVLLPKNQVPLSINGTDIKILDTMSLEFLFITLANINQENILIEQKKSGLTKIYRLGISLRFNIDNIKNFPIQFPWINTNFSGASILSEPLNIAVFIKVTGIDLLEKFDNGELTKIFLYI